MVHAVLVSGLVVKEPVSKPGSPRSVPGAPVLKGADSHERGLLTGVCYRDRGLRIREFSF